MRIKQDPSIRQEAFIKASTALFAEKGYDAVSIKDILAAVSDKSASPSVFYYYFDSKEDIYQACISDMATRYTDRIRKEFSVDYNTPEEWLLSVTVCVRDYLIYGNNIVSTGHSEFNRVFVLDTRSKVTKKIGEIWTESLSSLLSVTEHDAFMIAQFISGGISEMLYQYLLNKKTVIDDIKELIINIVRFSANTLCLTKERQHALIASVKALID